LYHMTYLTSCPQILPSTLKAEMGRSLVFDYLLCFMLIIWNMWNKFCNIHDRFEATGVGIVLINSKTSKNLHCECPAYVSLILLIKFVVKLRKKFPGIMTSIRYEALTPHFLLRKPHQNQVLTIQATYPHWPILQELYKIFLWTGCMLFHNFTCCLLTLLQIVLAHHNMTTWLFLLASMSHNTWVTILVCHK
jgi:hypothetical protein